MGKGNSFSISCSKKLTQCCPYIGLNTDTNSMLLSFKETLLENLGEKLLGSTEMFRKKKSLDFSNVLWLISDLISAWDVFTVENTDKNAFWLRGTYLEKAIGLVYIQIIYIVFTSDLGRLQFFSFSCHQGLITVVNMILFLAMVEIPLHRLNDYSLFYFIEWLISV